MPSESWTDSEAVSSDPTVMSSRTAAKGRDLYCAMLTGYKWKAFTEFDASTPWSLDMRLDLEFPEIEMRIRQRAVCGSWPRLRNN